MRRSQTSYSFLITSCLTGILGVALPVVALANPQGGVVSQGSASIVDAGKKLDVYQQTNKAVIDWRSFNIEADEHTQFHQPSAGAIALNRVNSADPSHILGKFTANGNIILINPNGVFFGKGAKVDVNGLIASTSDIADKDFMAGNLAFTRPGKPGARIVNEGHITAGEAGLVGLVAPQVENHGIIEARLGRVQLASADTFAVDFYGDGLLSIAVSDTVGKQLVQNTGKIEAAGGEILLTAAAGKQIVDSLIEVKGELKAPAVSQKGGKIIIAAAGSNGNKAVVSGNSRVVVQADIDASGKQAGQQGGAIDITGDKIAILVGSKIDASGHHAPKGGKQAGGDIHIGGGYQGKGDIQNAKLLYVEKDVAINNSAIDAGDAGRTILWSDGATSFAGSIFANGGAQGGDGGFAEVSGKNYLSFLGSADLRAANGRAGTLLLDPTDITISSAADSAGISFGGGAFTDTTTASSNLNVTTLTNQLALSDVVVSTASGQAGAGDITVTDAINWASGFGLTLQADNDIITNNTITNSGTGFLSLNAGGDGAGNITINNNIDVGGALTLTATGGTIGVGNASLAGDGITINSPFSYVGFAGSSRTINAKTGTFTNNAAIDFSGRQLTISANNSVINDTMNGLILEWFTDAISVNNTVTISSLFFRPLTDTNSLGLAGAAGDVMVSSADLDNIASGSRNFGRGVGFSQISGDINVGARSWGSGNTQFTTDGTLVILGTQSLSANAIFNAADYDFQSNLTRIAGSPTLTFSQRANLSLGGAAGTTILDSTELDRIDDGFSLITFGNGQRFAITMDAYSNWRDRITFNNAGHLTINGAQQTAAATDANFTFSSTPDGAIPSVTTVNANIDTSASNGTIQFSSHTTSSVDLGADVISGNGQISVFRQVNLIGAAGTTRTINAGTNQVRVSGNGAIAATDKNLVVINDTANIGGSISSTTGNITLRPFSNNRSVGVGDSPIGSFKLTDAMLGFVDAGNGLLTIGNPNSTTAYRINTTHAFDENVAFDNGNSSLGIFLEGSLSSNQHMINFLSKVATTGNYTVTTNGVGGIAFASALDGVSGGENLTVSSTGGAVSFGGVIGGTNALGTLSAYAGTSLTFPEVHASKILARTYQSTGDITLNGILNLTGSGTALELISGDDIINNVGAAVFNLTGIGSRFITWSDDSLEDVGDEHFAAATQKRYNRNYGDAVEAGQSIRNYSVAPTLTVTPDNPGYIYGDVATPPAGYTISTSYHDPEDAGAHVTSGAATFSTSYVQGNAAGSAYTVNDNGSTLSSNLNYGYSYAQPTGSLVVGKSDVRVKAMDLSITEGDVPVVTFLYEPTDFKLADTVATAGITGAPTISNVNFATVTPGTYNLQLAFAGVSAPNYSFLEALPRGILTVLDAPQAPAGGGLPDTVRYVSNNAYLLNAATANNVGPKTVVLVKAQAKTTTPTAKVNLYDAFSQEVVASTPDNVVISADIMQQFGLTYGEQE